MRVNDQREGGVRAAFATITKVDTKRIGIWAMDGLCQTYAV